jgi:hypothetical protein
VNGVISLVPVAGQGTPVTGLVSHLTFSDTVTNNIYQVSIVNGAYTPVEVVAGTVLSVPFVLVDTATSVHYQLKFVNGALQPVVSSSVVNALNAITMVDQDTNAHFTLAMTNGAFTINPA